MSQNDILAELPSPTPNGPISISEQRTFRVYESESGSDVPQTVYVLNKAPFIKIDTVRVISDGTPVTLEQGTEYEVRDTTDAEGDDSIAFIDSSSHPDPGSEFTVEYVARPNIQEFTGAYDDDIGTLRDRASDIIDARQPANASGDELDLLGGYFDLVGNRDGLNDSDYRALLQAIVVALSANGTKPGLKRAVAVVVGVDTDDVKITEDFAQAGYTVDITGERSQSVSTKVLTKLINRADPSGVELLEDPRLESSASLTMSATTSVSKTTGDDRLGGETLGSDTLGQ
jgi:hypothetical protein